MGAFEEQLPEAIDLLGRAIRAGHPLSAGMKMVADETQEPIASEFRRTHEEHRFGLPFEDALLAMADRVSLIDVRILTTAILIQREVGGNLAEVLDNLAERDPGALHHPPPAPGIHCPGTVQRLRAGRAARSLSDSRSTA